MGAYFSSQFFDRYTYKVDRLFLLSPAGFNGAYDSTHIAERFRRLSVLQRIILRRNQRLIYEEKKTPFELVCGTLRNLVLAFVMRTKRMSLTPKEAGLITRLFRFLLGLPQCGERCVCFVIDIGLRSRAPIFDVLLRHLDRLEDVTVVYGQHDSMDFEASLRNAAELDLPVNFYQVKGCDHQLILQRPGEVVALMLDAFDNRRESLHPLRLSFAKYASGLSKTSLEP